MYFGYFATLQINSKCSIVLTDLFINRRVIIGHQLPLTNVQCPQANSFKHTYMIYSSAQRYLTPKWQARVTPASAAFKFSNGVTVSNLWELKQALRIVREDIINQHIVDNKDIANWVKDVVKDSELAKELQKSDSRWSMIVALERQMMRTINLPHNVAQRWLNEVEWSFHFVDGKQANSLPALQKALEEASDETIEFHLERDPNDIAKWVNDIIGDYQLSEILVEATNRQQMVTYVADHLEMLHHALTCK